MIREAIAHESLGNREETCQFGGTHQVLQVRTYTLAIVETRQVPNLYLAAYGRNETSTGYRAVDQFGTEWFSDWDGSHSDGMYGYRAWVTADGRRIVQAPLDGRPMAAFDGWAEVPFEGSRIHR